MLHGEDAEQDRVDGHGHYDRSGQTGIDRFRHDEIANEADRIKKCAEKDDVGDHAVQGREHTRHYTLPISETLPLVVMAQLRLFREPGAFTSLNGSVCRRDAGWHDLHMVKASVKAQPH